MTWARTGLPWQQELDSHTAATDAHSLPQAVKRVLYDGSAELPAATSNGSYSLRPGGTTAVGLGSGTAGPAAFYFDPADYTESGVSPTLDLVGELLVNATAPGDNFQIALFPVTAVGGATSPTVSLTTGAATQTLTTWTAPAANLMDHKTSAGFALAAGWYVLGVTVSGGAMATNSTISARARLRLALVH